MDSDESLREATDGHEDKREGDAPPPLVGTVGSDFIRLSLSTRGAKPQEVLADIRKRGALRNEACAPLMVMLDLQGVPPSSAHKRLLHEVSLSHP
jgi:hypothetical protein